MALCAFLRKNDTPLHEVPSAMAAADVIEAMERSGLTFARVVTQEAMDQEQAASLIQSKVRSRSEATTMALENLCEAVGTDEGREELQALFRLLDVDGDGKVTSKEWGKAVGKNSELMMKYFGGASKKELGKAFNRLDLDQNGSLDWEEFIFGVEEQAGNHLGIAISSKAAPAAPAAAAPSEAEPPVEDDAPAALLVYGEDRDAFAAILTRRCGGCFIDVQSLIAAAEAETSEEGAALLATTADARSAAAEHLNRPMVKRVIVRAASGGPFVLAASRASADNLWRILSRTSRPAHGGAGGRRCDGGGGWLPSYVVPGAPFEAQ